MKKYWSLLLLCCTVLFSTGIAGETPEVRVWPWLKTIHVPTQLEQFFFLELPAPAEGKAMSLTLTLPEGIAITGFPKGETPTMPPGSVSVFPEKFEQKGTVAELQFAAGAFRKTAAYLAMQWNVTAKPGKYTMTVRMTSGNGVQTQEFPVQVFPPLQGLQPEKIIITAYDYPGLAPEFLPTYLGMLKAGGVTDLLHMRGDYKRSVTATDLAGKYGIRNGLVFFLHQIQEYYSKNPPPAGITAAEVSSLVTLLDQPEKFKTLAHNFFQDAMGGKPYTTLCYDAERGGFSGGKLTGDRSEYALKQFRAFAKLPADAVVDDNTLSTVYRKEWSAFYCDLSRRAAALLRELIDEHYAGYRFEVYSGYEYDSGVHKDYTRDRYGVDWKTMATVMPDFCVAGYGGTAALIAHSAQAMNGNSSFIPAEMYVENFLRMTAPDRSPSKWAVRLLRSYLHGSRRGLALWYANVFDGNALISIDRVSTLLARGEELLLKGTPARDAVLVRPAAEQDNCYVFRNEGSALILLLNAEEKDKTIHLNLKGFRQQGYTGALQIADLMSGEKIPAAATIKIQVPAGEFRALQLLEDGN